MISVQGPEDFHLIDHHLFISSTALPLRHQFEQGHLYYVDLEDNKRVPIKLTQEDHPVLSPHGLYARTMNEQVIQLWVINHFNGQDSVETFSFSIVEKKLTHLKTVRSPLFINSNDLVAVDDNRFYMTHDHGTDNHYLKKLENYTRLGFGHVTYFDGEQAKKVISTLDFPNGLAIVGSSLYVAQMLGRKVTEYQILSPSDLKYTRNIDLPFGPDNLSLSLNEEVLYVAGHPRLFSLKSHAQDARNRAPSYVFKINLKDHTFEKIFNDDGSLVSASSVATSYHDQLIIGNIYGDGIVSCKKTN